jgi:hypothetical protein
MAVPRALHLKLEIIDKTFVADLLGNETKNRSDSAGSLVCRGAMSLFNQPPMLPPIEGNVAGATGSGRG